MILFEKYVHHAEMQCDNKNNVENHFSQCNSVNAAAWDNRNFINNDPLQIATNMAGDGGALKICGR